MNENHFSRLKYTRLDQNVIQTTFTNTSTSTFFALVKMEYHPSVPMVTFFYVGIEKKIETVFQEGKVCGMSEHGWQVCVYVELAIRYR